MKKNKKIDLLIVSVYFCLAALFILITKANYLVGVVSFFGVPSLYLSIRGFRSVKKVFTYSFFISLPLYIIVNYIATISQVWHTNSVTGIFVLGILPLDDFFWVFLYAYLALIFYEYFLDTSTKKERFSPRISKLFCFFSLALFVFSILLLYNPKVFIIEYAYLVLTILLFVLPIFFILNRYPKLRKKILVQGFYFAVMAVIYELVAINVGHWYFRGEYIGMVDVSGNSFPFEELLWRILAVPAFLAVYEYFADDRK